MPDTGLNHASVLGIGFMHMLSIVHMLYLSRKSLSVHRHSVGGEDEGGDGRESCLTAQWVIAY
jgi:hypothetical protein